MSKTGVDPIPRRRWSDLLLRSALVAGLVVALAGLVVLALGELDGGELIAAVVVVLLGALYSLKGASQATESEDDDGQADTGDVSAGQGSRAIEQDHTAVEDAHVPQTPQSTPLSDAPHHERGHVASNEREEKERGSQAEEGSTQALAMGELVADQMIEEAKAKSIAQAEAGAEIRARVAEAETRARVAETQVRLAEAEAEARLAEAEARLAKAEARAHAVEEQARLQIPHASKEVTRRPGALRVRGLVKDFPTRRGSVRVLDNIDFEVAAGEFVCVVGVNGSGKSTLLSLIAGLLQPTSGRLELNGSPIMGPGPERGLVFQAPSLYPWRTVERNVAFGLELLGVPRVERRARVSWYLEVMGLTPFTQSLPNQLSGGQRSRAAIARALACEPQLLLLDEPFGALDVQTKEDMQVFLRQVWTRTGTTVIMVTHDVEEAVFLAQRVVVLASDPGRIADTIAVDLPPDRPLEIKRDPRFLRLRSRVEDMVRAQHHNHLPDASYVEPSDVPPSDVGSGVSTA